MRRWNLYILDGGFGRVTASVMVAERDGVVEVPRMPGFLET